MTLYARESGVLGRGGRVSAPRWSKMAVMRIPGKEQYHAASDWRSMAGMAVLDSGRKPRVAFLVLRDDPLLKTDGQDEGA